MKWKALVWHLYVAAYLLPFASWSMSCLRKLRIIILQGADAGKMKSKKKYNETQPSSKVFPSFFTCCAEVSSSTWQEENRRVVAATSDKQSSGKCRTVHERLRQSMSWKAGPHELEVDQKKKMKIPCLATRMKMHCVILNDITMINLSLMTLRIWLRGLLSY